MVRSRERSPIIGCGEFAASVVMTLALAVVAQVRNKAIYVLREFILPLAWGAGRCRTRAHFNEMIAAPGAVASTTIRVPAARRTGSRNRYVRVHSSR